MKEITKAKSIVLRESKHYYYSVEDVRIDVGGDGITISHNEDNLNRIDYLCLSKEMAVEIAKAILELTNEDQ